MTYREISTWLDGNGTDPHKVPTSKELANYLVVHEEYLEESQDSSTYERWITGAFRLARRVQMIGLADPVTETP